MGLPSKEGGWEERLSQAMCRRRGRTGVTSPRLLTGSSGLNQQLRTSSGRQRSQGQPAQFPDGETERWGGHRFSKITEQIPDECVSRFQKWPFFFPPQRATRMAKMERTDHIKCCHRLEQPERSLAWLVGGVCRCNCVGDAWRSLLEPNLQRLCAGQFPSWMWSRMWTCGTLVSSEPRTRRFKAARST